MVLRKTGIKIFIFLAFAKCIPGEILIDQITLFWTTLSFFISNAGKMRLVWSFRIFRVVAYFRCLEKIANIVVA